MNISFRCPICGQTHDVEVDERGGRVVLECGADLQVTAEDVKKLRLDREAGMSIGYKVNGS